MISWAFAFPIVLLLLPMVHKITGLFVDMSGLQPPQKINSLIFYGWISKLFSEMTLKSDIQTA